MFNHYMLFINENRYNIHRQFLEPKTIDVIIESEEFENNNTINVDIPEIVYSHHERLDGSGYPRSLKGKNIPVQARMMAITDIFDALVARDRPYKKAIPYDRAFNILEAEVRNGKLDGELFKIFLEAKVGDLIIDQNLPPKTSSVA